MNSVAPISSLAETLKHRLQESVGTLNNESGAVDDLELGIETIKRPQRRTAQVAETYRSLNKITTLNLKRFMCAIFRKPAAADAANAGAKKTSRLKPS